MLIGRDQEQPFSAWLGKQQTIKRIAMQRRHTGRGQNVMGLDRQFLPTPTEQGAPQQCWLHVKVWSPQILLDHELPQARPIGDLGCPN